jgi:hypothetical protein
MVRQYLEVRPDGSVDSYAKSAGEHAILALVEYGVMESSLGAESSAGGPRQERRSAKFQTDPTTGVYKGRQGLNRHGPGVPDKAAKRGHHCNRQGARYRPGERLPGVGSCSMN